jgi:mannose-6-phosphate isomerase-like protein (cupin superfamily)
MSQPKESTFVTKQLPDERDYLAPDGSEIRLLPTARGGGLAHCTLPPGKVTIAVAHRTVEEIWYCISGAGEVWRGFGEPGEVVALCPGTSLIIPTGASFQFRTIGGEPLCILIATMPPWLGKEEAVPVDGHWESETAQ